MASLNLSTNGPSITKSYQSVVNAPAPTGPAAASPTYGSWALFSVTTPLVNAFQQGGAQKESVLKVQSTGEGELVDLIEDFSEGKIQFGFVKVKDPNTSLPKHVLIAWCGEGVPERTKGYFTSHLAAVAKFLQGYHVQVTARSDRDLTPESIIQKVADASGAKYSGDASVPPPASTKPPVAAKPAFNPTRTAGSFKPTVRGNLPGHSKNEPVDEDGWGADAPPVTRTQLEKVESAYKPTRVNMKELASQKTSTTSGPAVEREAPSNVVKGGYQPIGKVDIAAIRRQAKESGQNINDRPDVVKGAYQPVGKVDIAAIRAKAKGESGTTPSSISPAATGGSAGNDEQPKSLSERSAAFTASERLTSLPKPKVAAKFGAAASFTGTKAPLPGGFEAKAPAAAAPVGTASRTFADQGGKTPAQLWAEKKAKQGGGTVNPPHASEAQPKDTQKGQETGWKSSYTGKSWAPVQTTSTGASVGHAEAHDATEQEKHEDQQEEPQTGNVGSIRDRFAHAAPIGVATYERAAPSPPPLDTSNKPTASRGVPIPGLSQPPTAPEPAHEETQRAVPPPPPAPVEPEEEEQEEAPGSPIRVAMPVGRGAAHDDHPAAPEQPPAPDFVQHQAVHEEVPEPPKEEEQTYTAAPVAGSDIQAIAQYDYEKAEDNEIELREGERITNIDMVDEDWWLGVNSSGEAGLFPRNYVELVEGQGAAEAAPPAPAQPAREEPAAPPAAAAEQHTATALYDYEAAEDNELSFPEDAKITNIEFPDEDWWTGEYQGKVGLFPANYVQLDS
ncbi:hypothetical protein MGYG_05165 [Nannizzia gypsea CBS 118893]|uniref:Actin binding protein n=1 Tax=Arthroderma gypseum (strain ATCC MYA-4604 / CBS 118893) TaxID=535722 RepID=E4UYJ9_ARTGP|nr:hypothetical protein MGYG_05165 [Nannizzia gypsea CBS 118893]EFR02162.1 hypothetical protein MGYG_05165 [Nannizzia gypsea CBS 118893]